MNRTDFNSPVSGRNTLAGLTASDRGTINVHLGAAPTPVEPAPGTRPFSTVPFPPDPNFIKRPIISQWLQSTLARPSDRAALVGLGGVGKSQLAIQHAYDVRRDAPNTYVLWVHASSGARFHEAYQDIAERLKLPGRNDPQQNVLRLVWRWLSDEENGPWLMVIDNADDASTLFSTESAHASGSEQPLASYIPKTGQGAVLVTSRSLDAAEQLVGEDATFQVPPMERDQATQLLSIRLGKPCDEDSDAAKLLAALDYLPLAIIQAASYIKRRSNRGATIAIYAEAFQNNTHKRTELLAREVKDQRRDASASNAVVKTWEITFDQVRRDRASAAELLCFMSFFNPQGIPDFILQAYSDQDEAKDLEEDIEVLCGYSLITTIAEDRTLEMHALVQFCTQVWLSTFDNKEMWRSRFLDIMSWQYPFGEFENWTICRILDPHIEDIIKTWPLEEVDTVNWTALLHNAANFRSTNGRLREAEELNRQTLEARTKALGAEHPDTLSSMSNLASVLRQQGKSDEAEKIHRQTLEARTKALGAEHPDTLTTMNNLASVLWQQGKNEEAEELNRQALEARTKVLGAEHPDTLSSMSNLASVLWRQGKNEEAEELNRQTLEARTKVLGAEHPDTLKSMNNLASVLWQQGKNDEAEKINRQTLEARTKVLGAEHPDTLSNMDNLASVLWQQGKNEEAEELNRQTLEARTKVLGAEHPDTLTTMNNLASVLWQQGKNEEAEELNRQTLEARTKVLGAEHPDTLNSMNNLASVLWQQGKNEEAEELNRQTLEARTKVLGAEHPDTLTTMYNLAHTLWSLGERSEATGLLQECARLSEIKLGPDHPHTQDARWLLGEWVSKE